MPAACATDRGPRMNVGAAAYPMEIAIAMVTWPTSLATAEVCALKMQTMMAFVTMSTIALEHSMIAGYAMATVRFTNAAVRTFRLAIAIVTETSSTPLACVGDPVKQTRMAMESVMLWRHCSRLKVVPTALPVTTRPAQPLMMAVAPIRRPRRLRW